MRSLPIYPTPPGVKMDTVEPRAVDSGCSLCSLREGIRTVCMNAEVWGPTGGETLLVVGQGPGDAEDRQGRPMVGASGSYFRKLIEPLWNGPIVLDNAVRCAPGARKITPTMVQECRPYGKHIWNGAAPSRVLALGGEAVLSILGDSFPVFSTRRGYTYTQDGVPVFFLIHPAAAMRNRFVRGWFEEDLAWALTAQPERQPMHGVALMVTTEDEAVEAIDDLSLAPWVTWDLETFGSPFNGEYAILNAAFTPGNSEYSYVLERSALETPQIMGKFLKLLQSGVVKHGGHNVKFDQVGIYAKHGVVLRADFDTMINRKLLYADAEMGLETCQALIGMVGGKEPVMQYVKAGKKELRKMVSKPEWQPSLFQPTFDEVREAVELREAVRRIGLGDDADRYAFKAIPPDIRSAYNATDTISTDRLKVKLDGELRARPDIKRIWDTIGRRQSHAITVMECNGVKASRAVVRDLQAMCQRQIDEVSARIFAVAGPDFNPNSQPQVSKLIYEQLGVPVKRLTDGAVPKPSVAKSVLDEIDHPVAKDILLYRRASHFKSQYADGMEFFIRDDGRIHPSFKIAGTGTGRPSCEDPNLLNIPRAETEDGKLCRDIFIAEDGYELWEFDYSQIELRVAAMLSGDDIMLDIFNRGVDFHLATAKLIAPYFKLKPEDITKEHPLRSQAKIVNFATLYGDPPQGLAFKLNISVKEAQKLQAAILGQFKKLAVWIKQSLAFAQKHGYCRTWWDGADFRLRPLWRIADHDESSRETAERSSWNTRVQGTAADYMNASLGSVQEWIEEDMVPARLVLTVYDSMLIEVKQGYGEEVEHHVKRIMTSWNSMGVPIEVDVKTGQSWGSLEKRKAA